jgi:hypothetical protein
MLDFLTRTTGISRSKIRRLVTQKGLRMDEQTVTSVDALTMSVLPSTLFSVGRRTLLRAVEPGSNAEG